MLPILESLYHTPIGMIPIALNFYPQIEEVAAVMTEFSMLKARHKETAANMQKNEIALIEGFVHNFERCLGALFVERAWKSTTWTVLLERM